MLSRRKFLSHTSQWLGGFVASPYIAHPLGNLHPRFLEPGSGPTRENGFRPYGRVAAPVVYLYEQASFKSPRIRQLERDDLFLIVETLTSPTGPTYNPTWYRTHKGAFVHSGRIQLIPFLPDNPVVTTIPENGILSEVTTPIALTYRYSSLDGWQPLYRLYYQSTHWVVGLDEGPDGQPWYRLRDTYPQVEYHTPARGIRIMAPDEYSPTGGDVPASEKRIQVDLETQTLTAYAGNQSVYSTRVSSGIHTENLDPGLLPTDTPRGIYRIQLKMPSRHMGDGKITSDYTSYELPGVPWVMVFQKDGVALHGTYWHNNFGTPMSHGCVNLKNVDAQWLFRWTDPVFTPENWYVKGSGTLVQVI